MSVRDRIQGFEAISHGKPEEKEASNPTSQQNGLHTYNMLTLLIATTFCHRKEVFSSKKAIKV